MSITLLKNEKSLFLNLQTNNPIILERIQDINGFLLNRLIEKLSPVKLYIDEMGYTNRSMNYGTIISAPLENKLTSFLAKNISKIPPLCSMYRSKKGEHYAISFPSIDMANRELDPGIRHLHDVAYNNTIKLIEFLDLHVLAVDIVDNKFVLVDINNVLPFESTLLQNIINIHNIHVSHHVKTNQYLITIPSDHYPIHTDIVHKIIK